MYTAQIKIETQELRCKHVLASVYGGVPDWLEEYKARILKIAQSQLWFTNSAVFLAGFEVLYAYLSEGNGEMPAIDGLFASRFWSQLSGNPLDSRYPLFVQTVLNSQH